MKRILYALFTFVIAMAVISCENERGSRGGGAGGNSSNSLVGFWGSFDYSENSDEEFYTSSVVNFKPNGSYVQMGVTLDKGYMVTMDSGRWAYDIDREKLSLYSLRSRRIIDDEIDYDRGADDEPWELRAFIHDDELLLRDESYDSYDDENYWTIYKRQVTDSNGVGKNKSHEYVDLGLTVLWATCNIGATKPEEFGHYYSWGDINTKNDYSWSKYGFCYGTSNTLTRYCTKSTYGYNGYVDGRKVLSISNDVAHEKWGGSWRMPTAIEVMELCESCTWEWTTLNGVKGYKVTSDIPGYTDRSIFLPAAGYYNNTSLTDTGSVGGYWTSFLIKNYPSKAYILCIDDEFYDLDDRSRFYGLPIRPVCP